HFFTGVPVAEQKLLNEVYPQNHRQQLMSLCNDNEFIANHKFSFTKVYNLFDETPLDYFYNAISLRTLKSDAAFLNATDSCGCASHVTKELSLYHSLIEFLERQALLGSWLSKTYRYTINPQVLKQISPYTSLIEKLMDNGDLYIFENGNHLPGYNILMFYFAHSSEDAVQYSVGSKSGVSMADTLASAFEELYQSYTFLYSSVFKPTNLENKAGTGYHMAFTQYNNQNTRLRIPFFQDMRPFQINTVEEINALPVLTYEQMLRTINAISANVHYYHYYDEALELHFTKIFSPDFFAHMSLEKRLNFNSLYANKLDITAKNAYLEMLPFP
ncbi:MAG: YcaO-like family protein, partial [bacterium]|nr:YcaO-like family protein [bacterium]